MGMIDPVNVAAMFIPAGAVARGGSIAETAGRFALANAAGGVASEASLQATQETRSAMESISNVAVDALVGGILGAGAQVLAGPLSAPLLLMPSVKICGAWTLRRALAPRRCSIRRQIRSN